MITYIPPVLSESVLVTSSLSSILHLGRDGTLDKRLTVRAKARRAPPYEVAESP